MQKPTLRYKTSVIGNNIVGIRSRAARRTAWRLAAIVALIITLTNIVIFTLLYLTISGYLASNVQAHVEEVSKTLAEVEGQEADGFRELAEMVEHRAIIAQSDEDILLLTDDQGKYVAGNVSELPPSDGWQKIQWRDLKLVGQWSAQRSSDAIIGRWMTLREGRLFVGDGNGDVRDIQNLILYGLLCGIGLSVICAMAGGYLIGRRAQRRIAQFAHTLRAVASGRLDQRVPQNDVPDDFDQVAGLVNSTVEQLQKLFGNLKQVSGDIAHDLRTPISRMRQKLELVRDGPKSMHAYEVVIDETIEEIDIVSETFDGLLRISEIEGGARRAKFAEVELKSLLANIVDAFEAPAEARNQHLHASMASGPVTVLGDRQLLSQLFANLIQNAIRHSPSQAHVDVTLTMDHEAPVVQIRDTGPGIPVHERELVFRRLYRSDQSRSTPGHGLGLSLAAAVAELHNATITLGDNRPGLMVEVRFGQSEAGANPRPSA